MLLLTLAPAQGGPRFSGDTVTTLMGGLVIGAVLLVFWASRPSVIARYSAFSPPDGEKPEEGAEKEPRA